MFTNKMNPYLSTDMDCFTFTNTTNPYLLTDMGSSLNRHLANQSLENIINVGIISQAIWLQICVSNDLKIRLRQFAPVIIVLKFLQYRCGLLSTKTQRGGFLL